MEYALVAIGVIVIVQIGILASYLKNIVASMRSLLETIARNHDDIRFISSELEQTNRILSKLDNRL